MSQAQGAIMRAFIAHKDPKLGLILTVDGKRFGLLVMGFQPKFYSDNAELSMAVNSKLTAKMSRNCALSMVKTSFLAFEVSSTPIADAKPAKAKAPRKLTEAAGRGTGQRPVTALQQKLADRKAAAAAASLN